MTYLENEKVILDLLEQVKPYLATREEMERKEPALQHLRCSSVEFRKTAQSQKEEEKRNQEAKRKRKAAQEDLEKVKRRKSERGGGPPPARLPEDPERRENT